MSSSGADSRSTTCSSLLPTTKTSVEPIAQPYYLPSSPEAFTSSSARNEANVPAVGRRHHEDVRVCLALDPQKRRVRYQRVVLGVQEQRWHLYVCQEALGAYFGVVVLGTIEAPVWSGVELVEVPHDAHSPEFSYVLQLWI